MRHSADRVKPTPAHRPSPILFVLAGSFHEALAHMEDKPRSTWRYVLDVDSLRGYSGVLVLRTGRWRTRPDIARIMELITDRAFTIYDE